MYGCEGVLVGDRHCSARWRTSACVHCTICPTVFLRSIPAHVVEVSAAESNEEMGQTPPVDGPPGDVGPSTIKTTLAVVGYLRTHCPSFEKYVIKNRERVLGELTGIVYAAGIATMRKWRSENPPRCVHVVCLFVSSYLVLCLYISVAGDLYGPFSRVLYADFCVPRFKGTLSDGRAAVTFLWFCRPYS